MEGLDKSLFLVLFVQVDVLVEPGTHASEHAGRFCSL